MKELRLHGDISDRETVFYFTTCGWMMWNWLVSNLALGATIVLYDGSPFYPDPSAMWQMAEELGITVFGTSAKFIAACEGYGLVPKERHNLSLIKTILSTGSPWLRRATIMFTLPSKKMFSFLQLQVGLTLYHLLREVMLCCQFTGARFSVERSV